MVYTPDFGAVNDAINGITVAGSSVILPVILSVLIMGFITRDINKWKTLWFPLLILQGIMGIYVNWILYAVAGLLFVIETLSLDLIGNLLTPIKELGDSFSPKRRYQDKLRNEAESDKLLDKLFLTEKRKQQKIKWNEENRTRKEKGNVLRREELRKRKEFETGFKSATNIGTINQQGETRSSFITYTGKDSINEQGKKRSIFSSITRPKSLATQQKEAEARKRRVKEREEARIKKENREFNFLGLSNRRPSKPERIKPTKRQIRNIKKQSNKAFWEREDEKFRRRVRKKK